MWFELNNDYDAVIIGHSQFEKIPLSQERQAATIEKQIDEIDEQLLSILAKRMKISKEIGVYKKEQNMPILQSGRYNDILENRTKQGQAMDLSAEFVAGIMKSIHEESVKVQMEIMK